MKNIVKLNLAIVVIPTAISFFTLRGPVNNYKERLKEKNNIEKQIEEGKKKIEDIENQLSLLNSEEFVEKVARERLGYIKENEIIFIEKE